ncbi:MAG: class I SAM-dependent methyltransferase [Candidatus Altiarchaeota archaeon]|nr:class I SAM-dependent methyltransferase [Candidatus Altiarchaeota archaeon]
MQAQKTRHLTPAESAVRILEEWGEGRSARDAIPKPLLYDERVITSFMRNAALFRELDKHLGEIAAGEKCISALAVGTGVSRPLMHAETGVSSLSRPMSWDHLELASSLEKYKRASSGGVSGVDWSLTVVEKNPFIARMVETQKVVLAMPSGYYGGGIEDSKGYIRGFLPGAKRSVMDTDAWDDETTGRVLRVRGLSDLGVRSLEGLVELVHVPRYYRDRIQVANKPIEDFGVKPESYDVVVCSMGGNYIDKEPEVIGRLLRGLKPNGILATDRDVPLERIGGEAGRFERSMWWNSHVYKRR